MELRDQLCIDYVFFYSNSSPVRSTKCEIEFISMVREEVLCQKILLEILFKDKVVSINDLSFFKQESCPGHINMASFLEKDLFVINVIECAALKGGKKLTGIGNCYAKTESKYSFPIPSIIDYEKSHGKTDLKTS